MMGDEVSLFSIQTHISLHFVWCVWVFAFRVNNEEGRIKEMYVAVDFDFMSFARRFFFAAVWFSCVVSFCMVNAFDLCVAQGSQHEDCFVYIYIMAGSTIQIRILHAARVVSRADEPQRSSSSLQVTEAQSGTRNSRFTRAMRALNTRAHQRADRGRGGAVTAPESPAVRFSACFACARSKQTFRTHSNTHRLILQYIWSIYKSDRFAFTWL